MGDGPAIGNQSPHLEMRSISKSFGSIRALDGVDFEVRSGEVMALVGENGAGKSTLVKILAGMHPIDDGQIRLGGEDVDLGGATRSEHAGIAVVQQELSLVPTLSIADNLFLGDTRHGWRATPRSLARAASPFLEQVGLGGLNPQSRVERLSVADQQLIEVARLLARNAQVLVFDEPTAALAEREIDRVKSVVRSLQAAGRSIVYVTHRLDEVFELADRVTVFRDGRSSHPVAIADVSLDELIAMMLGTSLAAMYPDRSGTPGSVVMEVRDLVTEHVVAPVTLSAREGEIVGLAGQLGSGASEVLKAIAGHGTRLSGTVAVAGRPIPSDSPAEAIDRGIGYSSSDRKRDGLFLQRTVVENLTATALGDVSPRGWLRRGVERKISERVAHTFTIDRARLGSLAGALSGGNQQKVAVGKWTGSPPRVLLIDEPTRGVDVGAKSEIYRHLRSLADAGMAIVVASSDSQEVLGIADTVVTYFKGRQVSVRPREETDSQLLIREITHPVGAAP
jgi:ABC-type sugar transport system ATPase subunit